MRTLQQRPRLEIRLRHSTYADPGVVHIPRLDASNATELLVALLLPFGNETGGRQGAVDKISVCCWSNGPNFVWQSNSLCICVPFFKQPIVQLLRYSLPLVVQVVDIPRPRMSDPHYWP